MSTDDRPIDDFATDGDDHGSADDDSAYYAAAAGYYRDYTGDYDNGFADGYAAGYRDAVDDLGPDDKRRRARARRNRETHQRKIRDA